MSGHDRSGGTSRRFWTAVQLVEEPGGFVVKLDGRPLRLPGGMVPGPTGRALAEAIAAEWSLAGDSIGGLFSAADLALTGLLATMQGHVAPAPQAVVGRLIGFIDGELLCYRAAHPDELVELQANGWQPWLDWLQARHGIRMQVGAGLMPLRQSETVVAALAQVIGGLSVPVLTTLGVLVPAMGSIVLGLAVASGDLPVGKACRLARLDEMFQSSHWGIDREAEAQTARLESDMAISVRFLELTR